MENKFTKSDLKTGYVVKLRNGELRMVMRVGNFSKILISQFGEYNYLGTCWDNNLERRRYVQDNGYYRCLRDESQDIVEVWGLVRGTANYSNVLMCSTEGRDRLWTRFPPVKMTLAEVIEKLGYEIEIVDCPVDDEKGEDDNE